MDRRLVALALAATAVAATDVGRLGYDDMARYANASTFFVGAQAIVSFSSASAHGPAARKISGHGLPAPEALCNCACHGADNFVYCANTAKTTVGVSTYAFDGFSSRWEATALRYFAAGSEGATAGRTPTTFAERAVLPDGPGGAMYFTVSYLSDSSRDGGESSRAVEIVRGRTAGVRCEDAPLCDKQCQGEEMYAQWRAGCARPAIVRVLPEWSAF